MNSRLLEKYNQELAYLRELGAEFAAHHPKIAGRLGMRGTEMPDPYVERLLEGFAFLTARVQLKMDAEFPRFSQRLLDIIYPNYLAPTPSMAIAELVPDSRKGDINGGYRVPRGTLMDSRSLKEQGLHCSFATAHALTLHPIELVRAEIGGIPPGLTPAAFGPDAAGCRSVLRMRFQVSRQATLKGLRLDRLALHLSGPNTQAHSLLSLLMQHTVGIVGQVVGRPRQHFLPADALRHDGFEHEEALLPNDLRGFEAYRLLQEYFAFPARFLFCSIHGLARLFESEPDTADAGAEAFELFVLLDRHDEALADHFDASHLALHCTPVINLYPKTADRMSLDDRNSEYHIVVDRIRPLDHEVYALRALRASSSEQQPPQQFRPFYETHCSDEGNFGAYFSVRREPRLPSAQTLRNGSRTSYVGSEVFVSLVDERHAPWHGELRYMLADVLCTNRDLPLMLQMRDDLDFLLADSIPVQRARLRHSPTQPRPALAEDMNSWNLISQLQLNYLSLAETDPADGARALRQLLRLHVKHSEPAVAKQIEGVRGCRLRPVHRPSAVPGPSSFARGIAIDLTVDEQAFSGADPYLFGCVMERLFSRLAALNSFVETTLHSPQRGEIASWAPRTGGKALL